MQFLNIDFTTYNTLEEIYTQTGFTSIFEDFITDYSGVSFDSTMLTTFKTFIKNMGKAIWRHYHRDRIAYEDASYFEERLSETLVTNVNRYFQERNIEFFIGKNTDTNKYILTSGMTNSSTEKGIAGSTMLQSSASTPTAVDSSATGDTIQLGYQDISISDTQLSSKSDGYSAKYTNYQGKTNGLHKNDVNKSNDMTRTGNFLTAIEMLKNVPYSYLEEVLKDVSKHFILLY